jgi:hypothetical protein
LAFSHGRLAKLYVNGYDLTSYFKGVKAEGNLDPAESSALGDSSKKFIAGLQGGQISGDGMHDETAGAITPVLTAAISTEDSEVTYFQNGDTIGTQGHGIQGEETSLKLDSPVDDVVACAFEAQSDKGLERVVSLRAAATTQTAGTTNSAGVDNSVGSSAGASGYLHVFAYGGAGTVAVKVQDSTDDSTYTDLLTFTNVTANGVSERQYVAGTVKRYLRAQIIKTGAGTVTASVSASRTPNNT